MKGGGTDSKGGGDTSPGLVTDNGGVNTGGASGGNYGHWGNATTGNGGSGVVILQIPTAKYPGTFTGSATATTYGSNTVLKFTGSGSYTA
jgi:hypothetical protein